MADEEFRCRAINDYYASVTDELDLKEGGSYTIMQTSPSGWWYAVNDDGEDGWVPSNYLERVDEEGGDVGGAPAYAEDEVKEEQLPQYEETEEEPVKQSQPKAQSQAQPQASSQPKKQQQSVVQPVKITPLGGNVNDGAPGLVIFSFCFVVWLLGLHARKSGQFFEPTTFFSKHSTSLTRKCKHPACCLRF